MTLIQHIAPAPVADIDASRTEIRARYAEQETNRLALGRALHDLRARWHLAGCPGGEFTRWVGGETGEFIPHGTLHDYLRSGEAQAAGIRTATHTESRNAGSLLREAHEQGKTTQHAVAEIQQAANQGQLKRSRNPQAPAGCTVTYIPTVCADDLEQLRARLRSISATHRLDLPGTAPEQLGVLVEALSSLPDDALAALLGGGEYDLELVPRAGVPVSGTS